MAVYTTPRIGIFCQERDYKRPGGKCGRVATHEVQTSGTMTYGKFCKKHAEAYGKQLAKSLGMEFVG